MDACICARSKVYQANMQFDSKSEYLRKYLDDDDHSAKKSHKKSARRHKFGKVSVKIIDEDITGWKQDDIDLEALANCEDGPQIVIDEKKQKNTDFSNKTLWKTVGEDEDNDKGATNSSTSGKLKSKSDSKSQGRKMPKIEPIRLLGAAKTMQVTYRDRSTGIVRNIEEETDEQEENEETLEKRKKFEERRKFQEKYSQWGKGLKQKDEQKAKLDDDLHEMSKPFARYADDVDLQNHLKSKTRLADPMLRYFQEKALQEDASSNKMVKPTYKGAYLPNRYDIAPGYRWDGSDRSNGFEKKWFETQNNRKAKVQEYQMWSVDDM